ncbi:Cfr10I/Bse634I restriction endonuclease [Thermanaeromonas toyohensis ToBE]|uniref:Cfr10I/Bse634I restriction endonuclease n=1 Tax=Thermanaeromonas toyohensis ToBE TaxID=698762 RepID=A0A1W1VRH5_9FIRM|nr:Cfr10I/Bse634I family restriction endonuclease [Thermanaeromonas toyohensis]SMB95948.1 Cfr10I/Bse634I restriction endonuclease [Thermanaeromonas toyohensis ToBE]
MNCKNCTTPRCLSVEKGKDGKQRVKLSSIESSKCLLKYLSQKPLSELVGKVTSDLLDELQNGIKKASQKHYGIEPRDQSFNNVRGAWFEKVVSFWLWSRWYEYCKNIGGIPYFVLKLPDAAKFNFVKIFCSEEEEKVIGSLKKHLDNHGVALETSNPDFVVVTLKAGEHKSCPVKHKDFSLENLGRLEDLYRNFEYLENLYRGFRNKCKYTDVICAIGVKDSLRPDRRLQLVYEGNIFKAVMLHFKTRFWDYSYEIPPFYAIVNGKKAPGKKDARALITATTSTLVDIRLRPERAVDETFYAGRLGDIDQVFSKIKERLESLQKNRV